MRYFWADIGLRFLFTRCLLRYVLLIPKAIKWAIALSLFSVLFYRFVPVPLTPLMVQRCYEHQLAGESMRLDRDWVPLNRISPYLQLAVVCSEDQNFLEHDGLDFEAIEQAQKENKRKSKRKRGASTIPQQTAKNIFLWPARSWVRKGFEVYFTALIEVGWSKQRIMEVYLNSIEMGDGVYGVEAASQQFFGKSAAQLLPEEAALIAACLPNPIKMNLAKGRGPGLLRRQKAILRQMQLWGMTLDYSQEEKSFSWAHIVALIVAPLLFVGSWGLEKWLKKKYASAT
jgi:monofunctional biosynthetic peptidoglycan transglycosylase